MRGLWAAVLMLGLPQMAQAEPVRVKSGEHEGFSRLVLYLPGHVEWRLEQDGKTAGLVFDRRDLQFRTGQVFDFIPRDRLAEVTGRAGGRLDFRLNCACRFEVSWHSDSILVVDILDPGPKTPKPERTGLPGDHGGFDPFAFPVSAGAGRVRLSLPEPALGPPFQAPLPAAESRQAARLSIMQDRVLAQIGRATKQGLLTLNAGEARQLMPPQETRSETQAGRGKAAETNRAANINLRASSSMDLDFLTRLAHEETWAEEPGCLPDAVVNVPDWGGQAPFHQQIGPARSQVMNTLDRPDRAAALHLARLYVFFGFGAEARQALRLADDPGRGAKVIASMAQILETGAAPPESPLLHRLSCRNASALWSVLARDPLPQDQPVDSDAVLRGFTALPMHLRHHLGPILAERFAGAGQAEIAGAILDTFAHSPLGPPPAGRMVAADLALEKGNREAAEAHLDEVIGSNSDASAAALLRKLQTRLAEQRAIPLDLAELAGAYAQEHGDTQLGAELRRIYPEAMAAAGAYDLAFSELAHFSAGGQADPVAGIAGIMRIVTRLAPDPVFLRHALDQGVASRADLPPDLGNRMARRLLDTGFPEAAQKFIAGSSEGPWQRGRRLLRAEIALELKKPRLAEGALRGLSGPQAEALLARMRSQLGEHVAAPALYRKAADTARARQEARSAPAPAPREGMLARHRRLLDQSAAARARLQNLLTARPAPAGDLPEG